LWEGSGLRGLSPLEFSLTLHPINLFGHIFRILYRYIKIYSKNVTKQIYGMKEVLTWTQKFVGAEKPKNALEALIACNPLIFPSTYKLLQILATLPVTTASSERSFSTLKRLSTYL